jgi:phenylpyruvate tautomerase PptA (4-oxalocrotonate tautomerase family)
MPVISIKSLPFEKDVNIPEILKKLNAEVANSINYSPDSIWSYWEFITPQYYAVGDKSSEKTTGSTHSPIIEITSFEGKSNESIETAMKTTAKVVSQALGIDIGNIFIVYKEAHSGMVFDGGNIVYKKS